MPCYRAHQRSGNYSTRESKRINSCAHCSAIVIGKDFSKLSGGALSDNIYCGRDCYDAARKLVQKALERECAGCGEMFYRSGAMTGAIYCNAKCRKEHCKPEPVKCISCGCLFSALQMRAGKCSWYVRLSSRSTCSKECLSDFYRNDQSRKDKIGAAFSGDKHPNWQGGKSLLNDVSNRGPNWKSQRLLALVRDKYKCRACGIDNDNCKSAYGRGLDVDHIVPFHNFSSYRKANELSNLQCMCASCHRIEEAKRTLVQMVLPLQDSIKRMHKPRPSGVDHCKAILDYEKADAAREMVASGMTYGAVGKVFGVSASTIGLTYRGKLWVR